MGKETINILVNEDGSPFLYKGRYLNLKGLDPEIIEENGNSGVSNIQNGKIEIDFDDIPEVYPNYRIKNSTAITELKITDVGNRNWAFVDNETSKLIQKSNFNFGENPTKLVLKPTDANKDSFNAMVDYNCPLLRDALVIEVGEGVTQLDVACFVNNQVMKRVILPESLTTILDDAFERCDSLEIINIPKNLVNLRNCLPQGAKSLKQIIVDPENPVYGIGTNCDVIARETTPYYVEVRTHKSRVGYITKEVFEANKTSYYVVSNFSSSPSYQQCTESSEYEAKPMVVTGCINSNLSKLRPKYLTRNSFASCVDLEEIVIPLSVEIIDKSAFSGCYKLKRIKYEGSMAQFRNIKIRDTETHRVVGEPEYVTDKFYSMTYENLMKYVTPTSYGLTEFYEYETVKQDITEL